MLPKNIEKTQLNGLKLEKGIDKDGEAIKLVKTQFGAKNGNIQLV